MGVLLILHLRLVGYKIDDGKLDLDLKYRVDNNSFSGDNKIFVDQVKLGERVDSPDATHLPIALGVALLKGADGRITLQVPIEGDIKNPQFDFGQTIVSALTGAMKSASEPPPSDETSSRSSSTATESSATSIVTESSTPSTATEIDVIKGEEVRFIEFEFGISDLSGHAMKQLDAFAKFLKERPALTLGIEGSSDSRMDRINNQPIDDKQLNMLALTRANRVKNYLVQKGKVAAGRLQLKPAKIMTTTDGEYSRVELHLSGR